MNEIHKKLLTALGFEVKFNPARLGDDVPVDDICPPHFELTRNGQEYANHWQPEEDMAWAQAPTTEALMLPLMTALQNGYTIRFEGVSDGRIRVVYASGLEFYFKQDGHWGYSGGGKTYPEAIAALFLAACEAGLVNPKAVVLP